MKRLLALLLMSASFGFGSGNLIEGISESGVDKTVENLARILTSKGVHIFEIIQHDKLAKDANLALEESSVVIFGAPKAGTPLMQCAPRIALELPLKFLIYKRDNKTIVAYEDIKSIAMRYDAQNCTAVENLSKAQAGFFSAITKKRSSDTSDLEKMMSNGDVQKGNIEPQN
ncbi:MAG: DUF302 domain-containing protein [Wolinella sp.]